MKNSLRGTRDAIDVNSLDEFALDQPDVVQHVAPEEADAWQPPEGFDALHGPPLTPVYLADLDGLDAFALDRGDDALARAPSAADAATGTAPAGTGAHEPTARVAAAGVGTPAMSRSAVPVPNGPGTNAAFAATMRAEQPPLANLRIPTSRRPRLGSYMYAAASVVALAGLTWALLNLQTGAADPPAADQPALARTDTAPSPASEVPPEASEAAPLEPALPPSASVTPPVDSEPVTPVRPAPPVERPTLTPPVERPAAATPPVERPAPAATPRVERDTGERAAARPPFPASQTTSAPVPTTGVPANLTERAAARPTPNAVPVTPPVRTPVSEPAPTVAAVPTPAGAGTTTTAIAPPTARVETDSPATANAAASPSPAVPSAPPPVAGLAPPPESAPAATPTPAAAAPANAAPALSALEVDTRSIRQLLDRYRNAFNALDASAARQAWPSVNQRALERAFDRLDEQNVSFDNCQINVRSPQARAVCGGSVRYVPSVGRRSPQVEQREWTFSLRRETRGWVIEGIETR